VVVGCSQHESATPYHAVSLLLRSVLGLAADAGPEDLEAAVAGCAPDLLPVLPLLGDVLGVAVPDNRRTAELTAGFRAERAAAAAGALLEAALDEPAIVVVEDLHWADPETRTVLLTVARSALPRRRWLLVLTSRHRVVLTAKDHPDEVVVELQPLSDADARELVYAAAEEGLVTLERGQQLLGRAGGNPFFLQELLRCDRDQGADELPDTVDELVQTQLDLLDPADRELLGYAAVLGTDIDPELLEATAGITTATQRRVFPTLGGFIEKTTAGGFRFRHALVQDGAYQRLPFARRRALHLAAAEALEALAGPSRPDLLALHTFHGRDWPRARRFSLEAAAQASDRFANLTAVEHYRHAIEAGRHRRGLADEEVAADWERLGDTLLLASSYDEATAAYRRAARLASPERRVRLYGQIGQVRERQGRYPEALRWYSRAGALAEPTSAAAGRLFVEAAIVRNRQGRPAEALRLALRAEATGSDDVQVRARTHYVRAWAAMLRGEDAAPEARRTLELFEAAGDLIGQGLAHNSLSMNAYFRGDWDDAAEAYEQTASFKRRIGDEVGTATAMGNLGELLSDQGRFDRARPLLEECRTVCGAAGFQSSRLFATMVLGRLDARVGNHEDAALQLKEALLGLEALGLGPLASDCHRFLAELSVFQGDHDAALEQADRLDALTRHGTASLRAAGARIRVAALVGRGDGAGAGAAARQLLDLLEPDARDHETALSLVAAAAGLRLGGGDDAEAVARRARSILARLGVVVPGELLVFGSTPSSSS
jgi:tetratricopeptide (TPR) repeat protein